MPDNESPSAARRVLLASPPRSEVVDRACLQQAAEDGPGNRDVLVVSYERGAEAIVDDLLTNLDDRPRNLGVVDVADAARSARATTGEDRLCGIRTVAVSLSDPRDLDGLFGAIEEFLDGWDDGGATSVVYVDSLTGMINRLGLVSAVGAVDRMGDLLAGGGRRALFRIRRDVHDQLTLAALDPRFDVHLALGDHGEWRELGSATEATDVAAATPSVCDTFELLSNPRRRLLLHGLRIAGGRERLADLATFVSRREVDEPGEPAEPEARRVYTGLWHVHLPKLVEFGVVTFEESTGVVELDGPGLVEPYLSLAAAEDLDE